MRPFFVRVPDWFFSTGVLIHNVNLGRITFDLLYSVSSVSGFRAVAIGFPGSYTSFCIVAPDLTFRCCSNSPQSLPAAHNPILLVGCSLVQHAFYLHLLFIFISSRYCRISDHIFFSPRVSLSISLSQSIPYRVFNGRVLTVYVIRPVYSPLSPPHSNIHRFIN